MIVQKHINMFERIDCSSTSWPKGPWPQGQLRGPKGPWPVGQLQYVHSLGLWVGSRAFARVLGFRAIARLSIRSPCVFAVPLFVFVSWSTDLPIPIGPLGVWCLGTWPHGA